ncbi:sulfate/molybdate ABC transporter ATP-binding protein [Bartonella sp. HY038]|uniref:sulfate/molybdate ABC transporter ATP-binding protein n=1 Tax=Bartonella sp. HY038 TaxID=2759660 RepID=UPI0015F9C9BA|nr:sulfate/molybdate ABC transporter ATP-binding protein [Bartonella sp. HY038]
MKITLKNIEKKFDNFHAVHNLSLDIKSGELIALLGPSGSGKTTLLRMVAGLEFADNGHIYFGEHDATNIPVRDRGVGFVFQHYALFPHMTILENIAFGMKTKRAKKRSQPEIEQRAKELLQLIQLEGLANRFPAQLSGGQKQRVALARALAVDPKVLLLDEPFGALDANVRKDLRRWLREIHDELGITTLFVTHDQEEALDLADRVVILKQGNIEQLGTPYDVCNNPQSAFVMKFLGDTHILPVKINNGYAKLDNLIIDASGLPNGDAQLFIRPDDLSWCSEVGQGNNALPVIVTKIMDRPGRRRLVVKTNDHHVLELDVPAETIIDEKQQGSVIIKRTQFFTI